MLSQTLAPMVRRHAPDIQRNGPLSKVKEPVMNISFGIYARPSSLAWDEIRKGPPLAAVREHLERVVNFDRYRTSAGR